MAAAPKRIACLALLSAIAPIVYLVGWARGIEGIRAWPSWLFYVWPFELLFLPFAGEKEFGVDYVVMGVIAVSLNVLFWYIVGLVLWRAWVVVTRRRALRHGVE